MTSLGGLTPLSAADSSQAPPTTTYQDLHSPAPSSVLQHSQHQSSSLPSTPLSSHLQGGHRPVDLSSSPSYHNHHREDSSPHRHLHLHPYPPPAPQSHPPQLLGVPPPHSAGADRAAQPQHTSLHTLLDQGKQILDI